MRRVGDFMALEIRTTNAQIGIDRTPAKQDIKQPHAELELDVTQAQVSVELTLSKITIDQTQSFAESGLKGAQALTDANADYAKSKMYESIGRISGQGNELTNIHNGNDAIASQAFHNAYDQFSVDYNMVTMPKTPPKIDVIEGGVDIQVKEGTATNNSRTRKAELNYDPGKVTIYLEKKNSVDIKYVGSNIDMKL